MREKRRKRVVALLWLLFATIELTPAFAVRRRIRGISPHKSRQLIEGTETSVPVDDKIDDKMDKEDDNEENVETEVPTTAPSWIPTSHTATSGPWWGPFPPATMDPTVAVTAPLSLEPSSWDNHTSSISTAPSASTDNTTSQPFETLRPSSDDVKSDSNSTLKPPHALSPEAHPNTLDMSSSPESRSSLGRVAGVILGLCSVACLGSFYLVTKRRQQRNDLSGGLTMSEEAGDDKHSLPPPLATMHQMNWTDVFHYSLSNEEKLEMAPACTTKSLYLPSINATTEEEEDNMGGLQDMTLSPQKQQDNICLRPILIKDCSPTPAATPDEIQNSEDQVDLYTQTIVNLMDCGFTVDDGEEKKCQETLDMRSVASEDLEYMKGTLSSDHLPATPRTSNVSSGGKLEESRLVSVPTLLTYWPEVKVGGEGEQYNLNWV
jgi:hypothetical protein